MAIWPDNPDVSVERVQCLTHGDVCNVSKLTLGTHTGTHTDGLNHFVKGAQGIDQMPLDLMVGSARVIEIQNEEQITADELKSHNLKKGERLLFQTINSREPKDRNTFQEDFVHVGECAAKFLAEKEVALIGVDYLSVGGFEGNVVEVHKALLGGGIWCVEGLDLSAVSEGEYEFLCLPIKLVNGDGGLTRAIARKQ